MLTQKLEEADGLFAADSSSEEPPAAAAAAAAGAGCAQDMPSKCKQPQEAASAAALAAGPGLTAGGAGSGVSSRGVGFTRQEFYCRLYGTVQDPSEVLQVLLRHKTVLSDVVVDVLLKLQLGRV
jgi:hypothetical protein